LGVIAQPPDTSAKARPAIAKYNITLRVVFIRDLLFYCLSFNSNYSEVIRNH
jgi:hypothetical protein